MSLDVRIRLCNNMTFHRKLSQAPTVIVFLDEGLGYIRPNEFDIDSSRQLY